MIEEDRPCSSLVIQVAAVQAAIKKVGLILIEDHLETCMVEAVKSGSYEAEFQDMKEALSKFLK